MNQKDLKMQEVIRELAAAYFSRESNRLSLITITGVNIEARGGRAVILFTVLPENAEPAALEFVERHLGTLREYIMNHARMMRVPFLAARLDHGEKNRQRLDEIGRNS